MTAKKRIEHNGTLFCEKGAQLTPVKDHKSHRNDMIFVSNENGMQALVFKSEINK